MEASPKNHQFLRVVAWGGDESSSSSEGEEESEYDEETEGEYEDGGGLKNKNRRKKRKKHRCRTSILSKWYSFAPRAHRPQNIAVLAHSPENSAFARTVELQNPFVPAGFEKKGKVPPSYGAVYGPSAPKNVPQPAYNSIPLGTHGFPLMKPPPPPGKSIGMNISKGTL